MKIVGDKVWAVSCQLQNHFTSMATNRKSVKYRVLAGRVDELVKGTGCDKRSAPVDSKYAFDTRITFPNDNIKSLGKSL